MAPVMLGERLTFEFRSQATGELLDILDYDYLPTPVYTEIVKGKDV